MTRFRIWVMSVVYRTGGFFSKNGFVSVRALGLNASSGFGPRFGSGSGGVEVLTSLLLEIEVAAIGLITASFTDGTMSYVPLVFPGMTVHNAVVDGLQSGISPLIRAL